MKYNTKNFFTNTKFCFLAPVILVFISEPQINTKPVFDRKRKKTLIKYNKLVQSLIF